MGADAPQPPHGDDAKPRPPKAWIVAGAVAGLVTAAIVLTGALLVLGERDFAISRLATVTSPPPELLRVHDIAFVPIDHAGGFIADVDGRCRQAASAAGLPSQAGSTDRERRTVDLRFMRLLRSSLNGARPPKRVSPDYRSGFDTYRETLRDAIAIERLVLRALRENDDDRSLEAGRSQSAINAGSRADLAELLGFGSCMRG